MPLLRSATEQSPDGTTGARQRFGPHYRWVVLGIGVAAQASFSAAITGLPASSSTMKESYHLSNSAVGLSLGLIYLGIAVSEIVWGIWTDRIGERVILLTGLTLTAAALLLMGVFVVPHGSSVPSVLFLDIGLFLVGILGGSVNGSSGRAVMVWFKDGQRGLAMSIRQTAMPAGGAVGTALVPWLAKDQGYRAAFFLLAALCLAAAVATWIWLHQPAGEASAAARQTTATTGTPLRRPDVWRLAVASAMLTFPQIGVLTFASIYLTSVKHASLGVVVAVLLVTQILGGAARIGSGRYTDVHGNRLGMVRLIGLAAGVAMVVVAVVSDGPVYVVAPLLALAGLFANAWHGVAYTEIASMAGAQRAGTALGLENTTVFGAAFLTPVIVPLLLHVSWLTAWLVIGVITLAAFPTAPRRPRDEGRVSAAKPVEAS